MKGNETEAARVIGDLNIMSFAVPQCNRSIQLY